MIIEGLTFEELASLVASSQCDPSAPERDIYESRFQEVFDGTIYARPSDCEGEFILETHGRHMLCTVMDEVWFTIAEHIGLVRGKCDPYCRGMRADVAARNALSPTVEFEGQTWVLEGDPDHGAPMYVAPLGWVTRRPYFESDDNGRWKAGSNEGYAEFGNHPTMEQAMRAAKRGELKRRREERRCPTCGHCAREDTP